MEEQQQEEKSVSTNKRKLILDIDEFASIAGEVVAASQSTLSPAVWIGQLYKKHCVDLSAYKGLCSVKFSSLFYHGGEWQNGPYLMRQCWLDFMNTYAKSFLFSLGEIDGKHIDVYLSWDDMHKAITTDAVQLAKEHSDPHHSTPDFFLYEEWSELTNFLYCYELIVNDGCCCETAGWTDVLSVQFALWRKECEEKKQMEYAKVVIPTYTEFTSLQTAFMCSEEKYNEILEAMCMAGVLVTPTESEKDEEQKDEEEEEEEKTKDTHLYVVTGPGQMEVYPDNNEGMNRATSKYYQLRDTLHYDSLTSELSLYLELGRRCVGEDGAEVLLVHDFEFDEDQKLWWWEGEEEHKAPMGSTTTLPYQG